MRLRVRQGADLRISLLACCTWGLQSTPERGTRSQAPAARCWVRHRRVGGQEAGALRSLVQQDQILCSVASHDVTSRC